MIFLDHKGQDKERKKKNKKRKKEKILHLFCDTQEARKRLEDSFLTFGVLESTVFNI